MDPRQYRCLDLLNLHLLCQIPPLGHLILALTHGCLLSCDHDELASDHRGCRMLAEQAKLIGSLGADTTRNILQNENSHCWGGRT